MIYATMNDNSQADKPLVDDKLRFRAAIPDDSQVASIVRSVVEDNKLRIHQQAAIMAKYDNEPPFDSAELNNSGQAWRSNQATGFLPSYVNRVMPQYRKVIDGVNSLFFNKLDVTDIPGVEDKVTLDSWSSIYSEEMTKTIRSWPEWSDFLDRSLLEFTLFGYTTPVWSDQFSWEPSVGRQDEVLFPNGTGTTSESIPLFVMTQDFLVHEIAEYLRNEEVSAKAGWVVPNLVAAIQNATSQNRESDGQEEHSRRREDTVREITMGTSFTKEVKVVKCHHLFVNEPSTGRVSHYIVNADPVKAEAAPEGVPENLLFKRTNRFDSMSDVVRVMTLDVGNGKLHGSKGLGRILYNTAAVVERNRNLLADNLFLSGLLFIEAEESTTTEIELVVAHPLVILPRGVKVVQDAGFKPDMEAFAAAEAHQNRLAEEQSGSFLPAMQLDASGTPRTASEVNYTATLEEHLKQAKINRMFDQFCGIPETIGRRICSAKNVVEAVKMLKAEKESQSPMKRFTKAGVEFLSSLVRMFQSEGDSASEARLNLMLQKAGLDPKDAPSPAVETVYRMLKKGLTPEAVFILSRKPSRRDPSSSVDENPMVVDAVFNAYRGDPSVDQQKLHQMNLASKLGAANARDLLVRDPAASPSTVANVNQQLLELQALMGGESLPVRPFDDDAVHLAVLAGRLAPLLQTAASAPGGAESIKPLVEHFLAHYQAAQAKHVRPEVLAPLEPLVTAVQKVMAAPVAPMVAPGVPAGATPLTLPPTLPGGTGAALSGVGPAPAAEAATGKPLSRAHVLPQ